MYHGLCIFLNFSHSQVFFSFFFSKIQFGTYISKRDGCV